jgi:endonuclease III
MGATLADAVLQRGIDYKAVVEPRVKNLKAAYPEAITTSAFAGVLERDGAQKVLDWTDGPKPQTLVALVKVLLENGIETEEELRVWLELPDSIICLHQIKGIKDKTTDYLRILVGAQTVAVDMHLFGFLEEAGVPTRDYAEAHRILREVAEILGVEASRLDHSIWRYGSSLSSKRRAPLCQAPRALRA